MFKWWLIIVVVFLGCLIPCANADLSVTAGTIRGLAGDSTVDSGVTYQLIEYGGATDPNVSDFEEPTYSVGAIVGQGGWTAGGSVTDAAAHTGDQCLRQTYTDTARKEGLTVSGSNMVSFWFYAYSDARNRMQASLVFTETSGAWTQSIIFNQGGVAKFRYQYWNGSANVWSDAYDVTSFTWDAWNRVVYVLDYSDDTLDSFNLYINGVLEVADAPLKDGGSRIASIRLAGPNDEGLYNDYDDVRIGQGDCAIHALLDLGKVQLVDTIVHVNRTTAFTNLAAKDAIIYVAADESDAGFDPNDVSCYTQEVWAGTWAPDNSEAGTGRVADIDNVRRRYFLIDYTSNRQGLLTGETNYDRVQLTDIEARNSSAGLLQGLSDDYVIDSDVTYQLMEEGGTSGDHVIHMLVDLGIVRPVEKIYNVNRTDVFTNLSAKNVIIKVAADEDASSFDPLLTSSYTQQVFSGLCSPDTGDAGANRVANITDTARRFFLIDYPDNRMGTITGVTNRDRVQISDIRINTQLTGGVVQGVDDDTIVDSGVTYQFVESDGTSGDHAIHVLLDLGMAKRVDRMINVNRTDVFTNLNAKDVTIYVAPDEYAAGFDPASASSYTQEVFSGVFEPNTNAIGVERAVEISSVTRQFFLIDYTSNYSGTINGESGRDRVHVDDIRVQINAADYGYNSTDATDALQAAIDSGAETIFVPDMGSDWIVEPIFLNASNQEIIFEDGVVVVAKRDEFHGYQECLFRADMKQNITLTGYGATFRMWKEDYADPCEYTFSEWRHGIKLCGCDNIIIAGLTIEETGGDGISVTGVDEDTPCSSNVVIVDVTCDDVYRNGISVGSVEDLLIDNCICHNSNGTNPQGGIDFEPDYSYNTLVDCEVRDTIVHNNTGYGVELHLAHLGNEGDGVDVTFENCTIVDNQAFGGLIITDGGDADVTVQDCLFAFHDYGYGIWKREGDWTNPVVPTYCVFWDNDYGNIGGYVSMGTGCVTGSEPVFESLDISDSCYMYLDETYPSSITTGASDSSYIGARPVAP